MSSASAPPLRGDGHGCYRVQIVGNSGSGKSTLAAELAALLDVPHIPLDTLFWQPGWAKSSNAVFAASVRTALAAAPRGWVVDGTYTRRLGNLISDTATDIIWLDPPLALYLPRLLSRTARRLFGLTPPCAPGCHERWTAVFLSRASIVWFCVSSHARVRRCEGALLAADVRRRRVGGWGGELEAWKASVREMVRRE